MPVAAPPERDIAILQAMIPDLQAYLLSDVLFWQMQAPSAFPRLSLGALLLSLARAEAGALPQAGPLESLRLEAEHSLSRWAAAAEKKAGRELHSRIQLWRQFLEDLQADPAAGWEDFRQEVTQRVIASLLLERFPALSATAEARLLERLDISLQARWQAGEDFIWAPQLRPSFPRPEFWFLYGRPRP